MRQARRAMGGRGNRLSKEDLVERERAIIEDIKAGELSYREIAQKHGVSLPTVNNKARKAGISRGRRKGARILVSRPRRRTATRKAARRGRPAGRKTRRRRAAAADTMAPAAMAMPRRRGRPPGRKSTGRRPGRPRGSRSSGAGFAEALRMLVLQHYPNMSLRSFDRLSRMIESEVR